jgi:hypothetical protein
VACAGRSVDGLAETGYPLGLDLVPVSRFYGAFRVNAPVAQWIEYCPPKAGVAGSIPAGRTNSHKAFSGFPVSTFPSSTVKIQLVQSAGGRLQVDDLRVRLNPAGQVIG